MEQDHYNQPKVLMTFPSRVNVVADFNDEMLEGLVTLKI